MLQLKKLHVTQDQERDPNTISSIYWCSVDDTFGSSTGPVKRSPPQGVDWVQDRSYCIHMTVDANNAAQAFQTANSTNPKSAKIFSSIIDQSLSTASRKKSFTVKTKISVLIRSSSYTTSNKR